MSASRSIFCWSADNEEQDAAAGAPRTGAAVLALRGPLFVELLIAQGCRPLSRHVYTVAALDPVQRNLVLSVADAAGGAPFPPVDALRRDLQDPLQPIESERDL